MNKKLILTFLILMIILVSGCQEKTELKKDEPTTQSVSTSVRIISRQNITNQTDNNYTGLNKTNS